MQQTPQDSIKSYIAEAVSELYTTLPAKVIAVKKKGNSTVVDVQPLINRRYQSGAVDEEPVLGDVPLQWPSGGGCYITFPIEIGDNVELNFSMRALTEWRNGDGQRQQTPTDKRLHALSDAFATPCIHTYQSGIEVDSTAVEISSGATEIRVLKDGTIELGEGAIERLIKGDAFRAALGDLITPLITHTHPVSGSTAALSPDLALVAVTFPIDPLLQKNTFKADILSEVSKTK